MRTSTVSVLALFLCTAVGLKAQTPFSPNTYVVLSKPGDNAAAPVYTLYSTTTPANSSSYTAGATIDLSAVNVNVNGIGLNAQDKLLYGAAYNNNNTPTVFSDDVSLYRIGADGAYINLGYLPVTGQGAPLPTGGVAEFPNFAAGTVTAAGNYVYTTIALKPSGVQKLVTAQLTNTKPNLNAGDIRIFVAQINNIASLIAKPGLPLALAPSSWYEVQFSDPLIITALNGFLTDVNNNYPDMSFANGGFQDIDINPANGQLYTYINYPDPAPSTSVDVVGLPVTIQNTGGVYTAVPVGTGINQTPDRELAGLAFDMTGNNLYALFTSGEYGTINQTTGVVENITISSIATGNITVSISGGSGGNGNGGGSSSGITLPSLRGDMARAFPGILPVRFGDITATIAGSTLTVNWSSLSETNVDHFDILVSGDGKKFTKAGTVASKAVDGNSETAIAYTFSGVTQLPLAMGGIPLALAAGLLLTGIVAHRNRWRRGLVIFAGLGLLAASCSKNNAAITTAGNEKVFVKIQEVDKDGTVAYSKIITAIME